MESQGMNDEEIVVEGLKAFARILAREFRLAMPKPKNKLESSDKEIVEPAKPASQFERLVGADDLADYLDMPLQSVWHFTRSGRIPCYRVGRLYRYNLTEVESALRVE